MGRSFTRIRRIFFASSMKFPRISPAFLKKTHRHSGGSRRILPVPWSPISWRGSKVKRRSLEVAVLLVVLTAGCNRGTRPSHVGAAAKDFTVQDSDHQVSLNQFRGQVVILNFWATWCPPCMQELPSLMDMQNQLRSRGVVVLGVSIDVDSDAYHRFLKQRNV